MSNPAVGVQCKHRILVFFWLLGATCFGQPSDARLDALRSALPAGWTLGLQERRLELSRGEEVYILVANRTNTPLFRESPEQTSQRIRAHGRPGRCRLEFRLEDLWPDSRWSEVEQKNAQVYRELAELPKKFGIQQLYSPSLSRKGTATYLAKTEAQSQKIREWQAEHDRLSGSLIRKPDYTTSNYGLFLLAQEGADDDMHQVDPPQASRELYQVLKQLSQSCPAR